MQLTLISTDPQCQEAVNKAAKLLGGQVAFVEHAHDIQITPGDIILWHLTESNDAIAAHLISFGRPVVLLVTRQQLGPLGGSLLRDPLPSLPHPIRYILTPFDPVDAATLLRDISMRSNQRPPASHGQSA